MQVRGYKEEKLGLAARTLCFICPSFASRALRSLFVRTVINSESSFLFFSLLNALNASRPGCSRLFFSSSSHGPSSRVFSSSFRRVARRSSVLTSSSFRSRSRRDFRFDDPARLTPGRCRVFLLSKSLSNDRFSRATRLFRARENPRFQPRISVFSFFLNSELVTASDATGENRFVVVSHGWRTSDCSRGSSKRREIEKRGKISPAVLTWWNVGEEIGGLFCNSVELIN